MPRSLCLLGTALLAGCTVALEAPEEARIHCDVSADCPRERVCALGRCRAPGSGCIESREGGWGPMADGTWCALEGAAGPGVCREGECALSRCGDGLVDSPARGEL